MTPLSTDFDANFARFVELIKETGKVWGLESDDGWAVSPSINNEEQDVMPFWDSEEDAKIHCVDEWSIYTPRAIDLDEFFDEWLSGMQDDGILVGINWNADFEGVEMEPLEMAQDLLDDEGYL